MDYTYYKILAVILLFISPALCRYLFDGLRLTFTGCVVVNIDVGVAFVYSRITEKSRQMETDRQTDRQTGRQTADRQRITALSTG